ncbi:nicotinate (nicotinamide) nucleotide adenylyltransferase [Gemmiger sp. An120]|uniref:bis(5'-nucleosyl)-tetraphosphatase (symmetrical) YqeK n=1 Tax=Gemmiger sp. An120 TaxID=1965549 RepID=UPI000B38DCB8|nr:bis(5'-nucleosyl)-tetraphosphatase (symmetrical) YqeK [Gemmiger sp. An120]OUQ42922.1 nicotinate (nicotinamide) nucleotide adenylyltransferase [Gemmiger sp. An120]
MRVLLFGGTFDPPHNGHIHLLQQAIRAVAPDWVVVMPACLPPHKSPSTTAPDLRLAMCRCFEPIFPDLEVSSWEIEQGGASYTIDTVAMLENRFPGAQIFLTVGSDMLLSFTGWKDWQQLLARTILVVQSRREGDEEQLAAAAAGLEQKGGRVVFAGGTPLEVSSSEIRSGRGRKNIPPQAREIIRRYDLYRPHPTISIEGARRLAKRTLSDKRYTHTLNVKKLAVKLAKQYGADPDKAALAALLHDIAKERPKAELLQILQDNAIIAKGAAQRPVPVWHGICAALLAQHRWGVQDEEVLSAIANHTAGKPGMTRLDKIIYLADMCSAERSYPEVDWLRALLAQDLDRAMAVSLGQNILWMRQQNKPIDPVSLAAYDELRRPYHLEAF